MVNDLPVSSGAKLYIPNFNPTGNWEQTGSVTTDTNGRVVVYSTGSYASSTVTLEGWIGYIPYPALVAQYDISITGSSSITGAYGAVHSNNNLLVSGGGWWVDQTATASGSILPSVAAADAHVGGFVGQGQPQIYIPKFVTTAPLPSGGGNTTPRLPDYLSRGADTLLFDAGYASTNRTGETAQQRVNALELRLNVPANSLWNVLTTGGADPTNEQAVSITRNAAGLGNPTLIPVSSTGWTFKNGSGGYWDISDPVVANHSFYLIGLDNYNLSNPSASSPNGGNAKISTNAGSDTNPIHITILSTGSVEIDSTPNFIANLQNVVTGELPPFVAPNFLLVAVEDIKVRGNMGVPKFSGVVFCGEQFDLSGSGAIDGQILSLSNPDISGSPVSANNITGNFDLTFNGGQAVGRVALMSWRQIKQ
jgi:hypothetical protein